MAFAVSHERDAHHSESQNSFIVTRKIKAKDSKRFTLFYVKRKTARWHLPFHMNAMLNLSNLGLKRDPSKKLGMVLPKLKNCECAAQKVRPMH